MTIEGKHVKGGLNAQPSQILKRPPPPKGTDQDEIMTKRYELRKGPTTNYFYDNVLKQDLILDQVLDLLNLGVVRVDDKWPNLTTKSNTGPLDEEDIRP